MGNRQYGSHLVAQQSTLRKFETEMPSSDEVQESVWQQVEEKQRQCCFDITKTTKRKVTWQNNFISNCERVKSQFGYLWAGELVQLLGRNDQPKVKYYREIHQLRKERPQMSTVAEVEPISDPDELERFKKNFKRSVIVSFIQTNKNNVELPIPANATASLIIQRKSRLEQDDVKKNNFLSSFYPRQKSTRVVEPKDNKRNKSISSISSFAAESYASGFDMDQQISKQTATDLQIFLKFSGILQRHLGDVNCMLGRIRRHFVQSFELRFRDPISASKQIENLIENVQAFLAVLNKAVMDFYSLRSFSRDEPGSNMFISNQENILSTCTAILFRDQLFYSCLFQAIAQHFKPRQQRFVAILNQLKGNGPEQFSVKDKFCLNARTIKSYLNQLSAESGSPNMVENIQINDVVVECAEPYRPCMNNLCQMGKSRSPINKLKSIMACSEGITVEIEKFYDLNGLRKEKWMLDADQVLSIFCYLIVGARVQHLHTHLFLLDHFASSLQMISMTGYYLSVIRCAVEQLENEFGSESSTHRE